MTDATQEQPVRRPDHEESPLWVVGLLGLLIVMIVAGSFVSGHKESHKLWITLLGVIATLGIFSILYKENPIFRFMEHIYIGLATAFSIYFIWNDVLVGKWLHPMLPKTMHAAGEGKWWLVLTVLIGGLFFTVYFPKITWMNRFILGVLMGWGAGYAFNQFMGFLGPQLTASFRPPVSTVSMDTDAVNNLQWLGLYWHPWFFISLVVLLCVMAYFFFSVEHRSALMRRPAVAGRYFLMITLGAIFGTTVMSRFTLVIGRFDFLIHAVRDFLTAFRG
jgi:hypothetical protein